MTNGITAADARVILSSEKIYKTFRPGLLATMYGNGLQLRYLEPTGENYRLTVNELIQSRRLIDRVRPTTRRDIEHFVNVADVIFFVMIPLYRPEGGVSKSPANIHWFCATRTTELRVA